METVEEVGEFAVHSDQPFLGDDHNLRVGGRRLLDGSHDFFVHVLVDVIDFVKYLGEESVSLCVLSPGEGFFVFQCQLVCSSVANQCKILPSI